jgi:hypothetical protein
MATINTSTEESDDDDRNKKQSIPREENDDFDGQTKKKPRPNKKPLFVLTVNTLWVNILKVI